MALPDTISGVAFATNHNAGPFASGGNYYFVFRDTSLPSDLHVYKSTNPGTSAWSSVASDTPSQFDTLRNIHAVQDGTNIHILTATNVSGQAEYDYYVFSMSSDSFTTTEENAITISTNPPTQPNTVGYIAVRSDGEIVALIQDATEKIHGTSYNRVSYLNRTSGTWDASTTTVGGTGAETNFTKPRSVLGASDKVHFTYYNGTNILHDSLSSADSLGGAEAVNDTAPTDGDSRLSYLNDGSNNLVMVTWQKSSDSKLYSSLITDDGTPAAEAVVGDNTMDAGNHAIAADDTNDKFYALYDDAASDDLFHDEYDAGWTTDVETWDAVTINAIGGANVYDNDATDTVLAYVVNDGGTFKYNEYVLIAAAAGSFPPRLRPLRMLRR